MFAPVNEQQHLTTMKQGDNTVNIGIAEYDALCEVARAARLALPLMPASKIVTLGELDADPMAGRVMETKNLRDALANLDRPYKL